MLEPKVIEFFVELDDFCQEFASQLEKQPILFYEEERRSNLMINRWLFKDASLHYLPKICLTVELFNRVLEICCSLLVVGLTQKFALVTNSVFSRKIY